MAIMRRDQLIIENEERFNLQNLDDCNSFQYIDMIFSETKYLEDMQMQREFESKKHSLQKF